ncbi:hypothetical protein CcaCcLH18_12145 [Colletotrichum camelliae]|nr:hypothetical protein CcaCcLH18_12145 [Colletotrichum camelliae]
MDRSNNSNTQRSKTLTARQEKERLRKLELKLQQRDLSKNDRNTSDVSELDQGSRQYSGSLTLRPKHVTFREDPEVFESAIQAFDDDREDEGNRHEEKNARKTSDIVPGNDHSQPVNPFGKHDMKDNLMTLGSNYINNLTYPKTENNTYNNTYYPSPSTPQVIQQKKDTRQKECGKLHRVWRCAFTLLRNSKDSVMSFCLHWQLACISLLVLIVIVALVMLYAYIVDTTAFAAHAVSSWAGAAVQWYPIKKSVEAPVTFLRWLGWMAEASTTTSEGIKPQADAAESIVFNVAPVIEYIPEIFSVINWADTVARAVEGLVPPDVSSQSVLMDTINVLKHANEVANEGWSEKLRAEFRTLNGLVIRLRDIETAATATGENRPLLCMIPSRVRNFFGLRPICDLRERLLVRLQETIDTVQTIKTARQVFNAKQGVAGAAQIVSTNVCRLKDTFTDLEDKVRERRGLSDWSHLAADEGAHAGDLSANALDKAQEILRDQNDGIRMSCHVMKDSAAGAVSVQRKMMSDIEALTHVAGLLEQMYEDVASFQLDVEEGAKRAGKMVRQLIARQEAWGQRQA